MTNLRKIVSLASKSREDFIQMVLDADMKQRGRDLSKRKKTLAEADKRIADLDRIFKRLYEDNISGKLSDERFEVLSADYEKEQQELRILADQLREEIEAEEGKSANVDRFLSIVERYTDIPELTPCILHEFVEKIVVHAAGGEAFLSASVELCGRGWEDGGGLQPLCGQREGFKTGDLSWLDGWAGVFVWGKSGNGA